MRLTRLGRNAKEIREALDLTQAQIAERMGATVPNVSKWERHTPPDIRLRTVIELAVALGTDLEDLLIGVDDRLDTARTKRQHTGLKAEESALLAQWRALDAHGRHVVKTVIESLSESEAKPRSKLKTAHR